MCTHLDRMRTPRAKAVTPSSRGCAECLAGGGRWVELRLCMTCGHVGCCDSSPGKHATLHWHQTQHPVMKAFEPGKSWAWCYPDEEMAKAVPELPGESPAEHYAPGGHAP